MSSGLADGYDAYYQARLWESLPEIYRAFDSIDDAAAGPLRELLNRIGVQVAVVRRSIDGLWADQYIETCADWVIPYLGALVATSQVTGLDPRAQRLDVANTIRWRRRKGTLLTAEAMARDLTGWDSRVVEGFRRLARTQHDLDPAPAAAGRTERLTRTPRGGFADLRSAPGALLSSGPFDQAFHHADLRRGNGTAGRFSAEQLVVYCWRLLSLEVTGVTPVPVAGQPGEYTFDPTGREIQLFLPHAGMAPASARRAAWQVPGPLTAAADRIMASAGIPAAYRVLGVTGGPAAVVPEAGRFRLAAPSGEQPSGAGLTVAYQYGLGGAIGAGTGVLVGATPFGVAGEKLVEGGAGLPGALAGARQGDTVTIADSRTYTAVADVTCGSVDGDPGGGDPGGGDRAAPLTVRARPGERPLIRFPEHEVRGARPQWVFHGGKGARLILDGLFVSGGDIVLRGPFEHVKIVGCTFDPGTLAHGEDDTALGREPAARRRRWSPEDFREPALAVGESVDGRPLLPTRIWIEPAPPQPAPPQSGHSPDQWPALPDAVRCLEIERSILGPIRTRGGGLAERIVVTDSILQGFRTSAEAACTAADVFDPVLLYDQLSPGRATAERPRAQANPLSALIWRSSASDIPPGARRQLLGVREPPVSARQALARALNVVIGRAVYRPDRWAGVPLSPQARDLLGRVGAPRAWLNRLLLEDAYPLALAPAACAVAEATVHLTRVTVLGRVIARRLHATDSILHGFAAIEDTEDGSFRYSAALAGSRLPARFNSAWLSGGAALFTSTAFGHPGYAQLLDTANQAITGGMPGRTLLAGSSAGTQLGAFPGQGGPARERALRVKYNEYLPFGLVPAIVHVT